MNYGEVKLYVCPNKSDVFSDTNINDVVIFATSNEQSIHIGALNAPNKIKISPFSTYITGELIAPQFALSNNKAFLNNDGVMNAISFIGDGSKLESLNASMITSGSISLPEGNATFNQVIASNIKIGDATIDSFSLSGLTQLSGSNANFSNVIITSSLRADNVTLDSSDLSGFIKLIGSNASLSNAFIESNLKIGNVILDTIGLSGFAEFTGRNASLSNITIMSNLEIGNVTLDSEGLNGLINLNCSNASISNATIESNLKIGNININETEINGFSKLVGSNGSLSNLTTLNVKSGNINLDISGLTVPTLIGSNATLSNMTVMSNFNAGDVIIDTYGLKFRQMTGCNITFSNMLIGDIDIRGIFTSNGQPITFDVDFSGASSTTLSAYNGATDGRLGTSNAPLPGGSVVINSLDYVNAIVEFSTEATAASIILTPNPFTINQIGQEGNIYLMERALTARTVNLDSRMALINTTSNVTPPVVTTTTANTSNIAIDIIKYRILRPDYAIFSKNNLHKPPPLLTPQLTPPGTTALSGVTLGDSNVDISTFFTNPTGDSFTYQITSNPKNSAKLSGSNIVISGFYRGGQGPYDVLVTANNSVGASLPLTITVTEVDGQPKFIKSATISEVVGTITYDLSNLFTNITGAALSFTVSSTPDFNNLSINQNILSIVGNTRYDTYNVVVQCSNVYGSSATNSLIEIREADGTPVPTGIIYYVSGLGANTAVVSLTSLFKNPSGAQMSFSFSFNEYNATITNQSLYVNGDCRNKTYNITVMASNKHGTSTSTATINVTEVSGIATIKNSGAMTELTIYSKSLDLSTLLNIPPGVAMTYTLISTDYPQHTTISGNLLNVVGAYRNITWSIYVKATNKYGPVSGNVYISVQENNPAPTLRLSFSSLWTLTTYSKSINIADAFNVPPDTGTLTINMGNNLPQNVQPFTFANNILTVNPNNRGILYEFYFSGSTSRGIVSNYTVYVREGSLGQLYDPVSHPFSIVSVNEGSRVAPSLTYIRSTIPDSAPFKSDYSLLANNAYNHGQFYWTVPKTGRYEVWIYGGGGGGTNGYEGGGGAGHKAFFDFGKGSILTLILGVKGETKENGGGGGGCTMITGTQKYSNILFIAGGGGGASVSKSGENATILSTWENGTKLPTTISKGGCGAGGGGMAGQGTSGTWYATGGGGLSFEDGNGYFIGGLGSGGIKIGGYGGYGGGGGGGYDAGGGGGGFIGGDGGSDAGLRGLAGTSVCTGNIGGLTTFANRTNNNAMYGEIIIRYNGEITS